MAGFALKIKCKGGQNIVKGLTALTTVLELKKQLAELSGLNVNDILVLAGFPPKPVNLGDDKATLESLKICSGDTLIVEERQSSTSRSENEKNQEHNAKQVENDAQYAHIAESQLNCPGILMRKVVPSDNSCLFTSIGYVLGGKSMYYLCSYCDILISNFLSAIFISFLRQS